MPQGTPLGPLLFIILYINDIIDYKTNYKTKLSADNMIFYITEESAKELSKTLIVF